MEEGLPTCRYCLGWDAVLPKKSFFIDFFLLNKRKRLTMYVLFEEVVGSLSFWPFLELLRRITGEDDLGVL